MNLFIDSRSATFSYSPDSFENLIDRLERLGYEPLMRKAAQNFSQAFGGSGDEVLSGEDDELEDLEKECEFGRRKLMSLEKLGYDFGLESHKGTTKTPEIRGEVFFSEDGAGLLFVTMVDYYTKGTEQKPTPDTVSRLRIGFIGDPDETGSLLEFSDAVAKAFEEKNVDIVWTNDVVQSKQDRKSVV